MVPRSRRRQFAGIASRNALRLQTDGAPHACVASPCLERPEWKYRAPQRDQRRLLTQSTRISKTLREAGR